MYEQDCMDLQEQRIAEAEEYDEFKTDKPIRIKKAIKERDIATIKLDLSVYSANVDHVLYERTFSNVSEGMTEILVFLRLAVESNNLHVLKAVWNYGIEVYFKYRGSLWSTVLVYISELIAENDKPKMLKFLINQIKVDNVSLQLMATNERSKLSGAKRKYVIGNLLDAAIYYNNLEAMELLMDSQPKSLTGSFFDYLNDKEKNFMKISYNNQEFFCCDYYSKNTLYSSNHLIYAFDSGNVEAIDLLIKNGYEINFKALDFTYQLAYFAHIDTIKYLYKHFKHEFKNLDMDIILKSTNHILLKIMIAEGSKLDSDSFNLLFCYELGFQEFALNEYEKAKIKGIKKCIRELVKQNIEVTDIRFGIIHALLAKDQPFLDLLLSLYSKHDEIDVTPIFYNLIKNLDMLEYLSKHKKLICNPDEIKYHWNVTLKTFKKVLSFIEFETQDSKLINSITKQILNLNAVTSIKLLVSSNFITIDNYHDAVDYIAARDLDKLLSILISVFNNLGGVQKNYVI